MKLGKRTSIHIYLLFAAYILALSFRMIRLDSLPLGNMEAEIALQALGAARGSATQFGSNMAVVGLTGLDFFIFSAGNFLARFWTAFFGTLVVFIPFVFRKQIGVWAATVSSFILAISPEMVGLSRIIGSPMMALVCLLLALGLMQHKKPILTGVMFGFGLMSGPGFWMGVVILGLSLLIATWVLNISEIFPHPILVDKRAYWIRFGLSFIFTLVVVGSSFFLAPSGISGIFSGLVEFLKGFTRNYSPPFFYLPLAMVAYMGAALVFGVWGGLRAILIRNTLDLFLLIWGAVGLIFIFLYPSNKPADLIWVSLPLWFLSARVVFFAWRVPESSHFVMIVAALLVIILSAFMLLALRTLVNQTLAQNQQINYLIALAGGAVLLVAIVLLVSFGWSEDVALSGLLLGLGFVICATLISVSVNSTGLAPKGSYELWYPEESTLSTKWLTISIDRILAWNAMRETPIEIAVSDYETPGMVWALRNYDPVNFVAFLAPQSQPDILITDDRGNPELVNSYRGQDLVWSREVLWKEMSAFQYLSWLITRDAPTRTNQIIFWVRTDLMPDNQFSP